MLKRRSFTQSLAATMLPFSANAATRPNVILVMSDDQGYGDFSCHGNPDIKTPQMDRLRKESVAFTDFHVAPMCTPTRAQLMTGRNCLFTRAMNVSSGRTPLRRDLPTMAEAFAQSGYATGIFGKWHLGDNYPYRPEDRGFQEAVWFPSSHIGAVPDYWTNDYFNDTYRHNGKLQAYKGYCTDVFFDEAMQWMRRQQSAGKPFFTYLPLNAPHGPLYVPAEFREPYKHLPETVQRLYAMIANIDRNLGRLEAMLQETGLRENTILIYLTDNGATAAGDRFNAGRRGHKTMLYEGGHRVPLFVRWPAGKVGGGREVDELTQVQDLFPTLIELCELKPAKKPEFDGHSVAGFLRNTAKAMPDRTLIIQFSRMNASRPRKDDACILWKKWRMVHGGELYNVDADPDQKNNVKEANPQVAARLQGHYDKWWATVEPFVDSFLPTHIGSEKENPVMVTACEWADVFLDQGAQVRNGVRKNGVWHVYAEEAGEYEIALRRWPREVDAALTADLPARPFEDGTIGKGVALPIGKARLKIGGYDQTVETKADDREAVFRMKLAKGAATMQSWFLDAQGQEITGAYYAYVERKTKR
ncbi:MAG: arylsulfatase [Bryobacterales bacterium]|nr:arylsulfatase [Bryobacterales bacterium]